MVFQNDSSMSWVINRKMIFMIRIVSSTVRVSFLAGVALVLAGSVNVYSDDVKALEADGVTLERVKSE